jgi:cyclic pyranopterin phosphate synthase
MTGRRFQYLRLSVTSRCSLSCLYCRPPGSNGDGQTEEFSVQELRLLVECAAAEGARKVRITGGEPLERADLEEVVAAVSSVPGIAEVAMTTNGVGLAGRACGLRGAGLRRVNVSLDTLRPGRFTDICGRDCHAQVISGIEQAVRTFGAVKVNAVLLRGVNDDEIEDLVRFGAGAGVRVRFIERYDAACGSPVGELLPGEEVRGRLRAAFGTLVPMAADSLSVEAVYKIPSLGGATVGLIASATGPPCGRCTKLRLAGSGELLPCLFARRGVQVRGLLQSGRREGVRAAIRTALGMKGGSFGVRRLSGAVSRVGG